MVLTDSVPSPEGDPQVVVVGPGEREVGVQIERLARAMRVEVLPELHHLDNALDAGRDGTSRRRQPFSFGRLAAATRTPSPLLSKKAILEQSTTT